MVRQSFAILTLSVAVLGTFAFWFTASCQAQLNCQTQQCVVVAFVAGGGGGGTWNKRCYMQSALTGAYAFSSTFAHPKMYGVNSVGGTPGTSVSGYYVPCQGNTDCPDAPLPCSGTVTIYTDTPVGQTFNTACLSGS